MCIRRNVHIAAGVQQRTITNLDHRIAVDNRRGHWETQRQQAGNIPGVVKALEGIVLNVFRLNVCDFLGHRQRAGRVGGVQRGQPAEIHFTDGNRRHVNISTAQRTVHFNVGVGGGNPCKLHIRSPGFEFDITRLTSSAGVTGSLYVASVQQGAVFNVDRHIGGLGKPHGVGDIAHTGEVLTGVLGLTDVAGEVIAGDQVDVTRSEAVRGEGQDLRAVFDRDIRRLQGNVARIALRGRGV